MKNNHSFAIIFFFFSILSMNSQNYVGFIESGATFNNLNNKTEFITVGTQDTAKMFFNIHTIHGITFKKASNLFIGGGIGYEQYNNFSVVPYYIMIRSTLLNEGFLPPLKESFQFNIYLSAAIGKSSLKIDNLDKNDIEVVKGDIYMRTGLGLLFNFNNNTGLNVNGGYKIQRFSFENNSSIIENSKMSNIYSNIGMLIRFN